MVATSPTESEPYFDLGSHHRPVRTGSPDAQLWFDRGLIWAYGFNHEEAIWCFEQALAADPELAMAHWGIAYAVGPNYNKAWADFDPVDLATSLDRARRALDAAADTAVDDRDRALITALAARFPPLDDADTETLQVGAGRYADAMTDLADRYPGDLDLQALAADACINVTPWALWDIGSGEPAPDSRVLTAKRLLDHGLGLPDGPAHPGLLHFLLHTMEMSASPQDALPAADLLRDLVPEAGHLRHMPSHIDVLCGDYRNAVAANLAAAEVNRRFLQHRGPLNFYTLYRAHDLHFVVYAAMFAGQSAVARAAAQELSGQLTPELLQIESPPMADWLEAFVPLPVHVLIRFGDWQQLAGLELPDDPDLYCSTVATIHYGRGLGYAATGRLAEARAEREAFRQAYQWIPGTRMLFNNTVADILAIAAAMLDGEIAYREGDFDSAFGHLRKAVQLDDSLPYDEPWGWMQPSRHALGALLLEQGRLTEAAVVYAADLGLDPTLARACQHPGNVWSLHGYHECLQRLGREQEAAIIGGQLELARARADVPITASCACRLDTDDTCCE